MSENVLRRVNSRAPSDPISRLETGHPSQYPTPTIGTDTTSALAMRPPQNSNQIYVYANKAEAVWDSDSNRLKTL